MLFKSHKKKPDAADHRVRQQNVWQQMRRIIERCTPARRTGEPSKRVSERSVRIVPVVVVSVNEDSLDLENAIFGVTYDFSDNGVGILSTTVPDCNRSAIVAFNVDEPTLLLGIPKRSVSFGGHFHRTGIQVNDVIDDAVLVNEIRGLLEQLRADRPSGKEALAAV